MPLIKFEIVSEMKKNSNGGHNGADAKTSLSLVIIRYTVPRLSCLLCPMGRFFFALFGSDSALDENISAPLKMESALMKKSWTGLSE